MKILVLSDSHSSMRFMRICMAKISPDTVIHLGDYYEDAQELALEHPDMVFHMVPGNCDLYRMVTSVPMKRCYPVGGVKMLMVHGHEQGVKSGISTLVRQAREEGAKAALYGHTHIPDCHQEEDGLWVLNPGSSRSGTAGLIETADDRIVSCKILTKEDLEEIL